jgi:toxin ParE1/3/4
MGHVRSPEADSDLENIWNYVAIDSGSQGIADRLIDSITDRFFLLATRPNIGRSRDQDLRPGLRSFSVGAFVIIYRIQGTQVLILRVLHGARDLRLLLGHS